MQLTSIIYKAAVTVGLALACALPAHAAGVSGQGTWETTLLGRDINRNAVAATDASAVYLYDTTLNVTWLRDANDNGLMNWATATSWAADLSTGSGADTIDDWRLPTMAANPSTIFSYDGSTAYGHNVPASSSEMASLFFNTLGNKSYYNTSGAAQAGYGLTNTGSFQNLQSHAYWLATEYAPGHFDAWDFNTKYGGQFFNHKSIALYALAVRTGDVSPAPEPETYAMLLAGLGLMGAVTRRRKTKKA